MAAESKHFVIAGAGLAGALMAVLLGKAGHRVTVVERRTDPRLRTADEGRSINLAISTRGLAALARAGLEKTILEIAVPMRGRMIHGEDESVVFQPYGPKPEHAINSVSRSELNIALIEAADALDNVSLRFGRSCVGADLDAPSLSVRGRADGETAVIAGDAVIASDGAFSRVRRQMQRSGRFDFSQSYLDHGYKELTIPAAGPGEWAMEPNALHIWPRGRFMMIALPNLDGTFTCTLFWPYEGRHSFEAIRTREELLRFFRRTFPDAVPLMPKLADEYFENRTGSLVTVRCRPWHRGGKVLLLGDSAHAVVPFYGQGANAAFEDCILLGDAIESAGGDLSVAFPAFADARKPHADALADLALANYVEMRDHTASRLFRLRKWLEHRMYAFFPGLYVPLYNMVSFSRIPYGDAVRRAARQKRVALAAGVGAAAAVLLAAAWFAGGRAG